MKLKITVDGKPYEVDVEVSEDYRNGSGAPSPYYAPRSTVSVPSPAMAPPRMAGPAAPVANEDKVCRSPIAGLVVKVNTHAGQQIKMNDPLMVLEAMKMETNITSPVDGKVKAVNANSGDPVQAGQVLVEFE